MGEANFPFEDERDFETAERGRPGVLDPAVVKNDPGETVRGGSSHAARASS